MNLKLMLNADMNELVKTNNFYDINFRLHRMEFVYINKYNHRMAYMKAKYCMMSLKAIWIITIRFFRSAIFTIFSSNPFFQL